MRISCEYRPVVAHELEALIRDVPAAVDVEPRMLRGAQQVRPFGRQQPLVDQKRDDPRAEEFLQRREAGLGHHIEEPTLCEEPVGGQRVEVGVEVEVFAEGIDGHHDAGDALGQAQRGALELGQAVVGDAAEFLDEPAVEAEVGAQHLGDREGQMPVRHWRENGLGQQGAEELHLLLLAGGAEPPALAGERQQFSTRFLYRQFFWRAYPADKDLALPLILCERKGELSVLVAADEIKQVRDLEDLIRLVGSRVAAAADDGTDRAEP